MAKKKRRKRQMNRGPAAVATEPGPAAPEPGGPSNRQLRKEQARIERERRLRRARRQIRARRAIRWGLPFLLIVAVAGFFLWRNVTQSRAAAQAADAFGCGAIETQQDQLDAAGALGPAIHQEPFAQGAGGEPATAGAHSSPLPPEPAVYGDPVPEANAVHNLEHGYILIYYQAEGDAPLPDDARTELESLAEGQDKVIVAPYAGLGSSLAFAAWGQLQTCTPPAGADSQDAVLVAEHFIGEFKSGGLAPEPNAQ